MTQSTLAYAWTSLCWTDKLSFSFLTSDQLEAGLLLWTQITTREWIYWTMIGQDPEFAKF